MNTRPKDLLVNLALLLVVAAISVPLLELAVRVAMPQPQSWFDLYRKDPGQKLFDIQPNLDKLIDTGDTRWQVRTDGQGFRTGDRSGARAPADAPTLLVVGDSFGFAYGVDYEDSFVGHLQVSTGTTARVVNASVPGYGPKQYRIRLEQVLAAGVEPDAVLIPVYAGNDYNDCVWDKDLPVVRGILGGVPGGPKGWLKLNSHLYRLVSNVYHQFAGAPQQDNLLDLYRPPAWNAELLSKARTVMGAELAEIKRIVEARGAKLFVVFIPTLESVEDAAGNQVPEILQGLSLQLPRDQFVEIVNGLDLPFMDLTPALATKGGKATYFEWNRHLTPLGNEIASAEILERWTELQRLLRAPRPTSP